VVFPIKYDPQMSHKIWQLLLETMKQEPAF